MLISIGGIVRGTEWWANMASSAIGHPCLGPICGVRGRRVYGKNGLATCIFTSEGFEVHTSVPSKKMSHLCSGTCQNMNLAYQTTAKIFKTTTSVT
jgi:hypothetical protein